MEFFSSLFSSIWGSDDDKDEKEAKEEEKEEEWKPGMPMPVAKPQPFDHDSPYCRTGDLVARHAAQSAPMEHYSD